MTFLDRGELLPSIGPASADKHVVAVATHQSVAAGDANGVHSNLTILRCPGKLANQAPVQSGWAEHPRRRARGSPRAGVPRPYAPLPPFRGTSHVPAVHLPGL